MISGIDDHYGGVLAQVTTIGKLAITEVDLNAPTHWNSLGDFKAQIQSHRPPPLQEERGGHGSRRAAVGNAEALPSHELDHVVANLELMPLRMNIGKRDKMGQRQMDLWKRMKETGVLTQEAGTHPSAK